MTMTDRNDTTAGTASEAVTHTTTKHEGTSAESRLTSEQVWREVAKGSFAVLGYVTPAGEPRSSGVVYQTLGERLYVAVAPESWKARHVAIGGRVAVTVPLRRGGFLSLLVPIPPATVSFHGTAIVHPHGSPEVQGVLQRLASLLPADRQASASIIEVVPEGVFVTYGVGVSLMKMRDPAAACARIAVAQEANPS
jgi:hypothetical protein